MSNVDLPRIVAPAPGPFFGARLMLVLAALTIAIAAAGFRFSPETPEGAAAAAAETPAQR